MSDDTELRIQGYNSLDDIEGIIQGREAAGFRFKQNRVVGTTNVVMFEEMPYGERPKPRIVFRQGQPPIGDGMKLLWKGSVATSNGTLTVSAYR